MAFLDHRNTRKLRKRISVEFQGAAVDVAGHLPVTHRRITYLVWFIRSRHRQSRLEELRLAGRDIQVQNLGLVHSKYKTSMANKLEKV